MEQNKDEKKPLKGKRAPSKKRGNTAASSSENVRRKKRKKTGGRSNMPMRDASLPAGQAPGATQPNHDETEAMTNDLCDSINIIKQYIQNKCDDGTVFKNDEFTEDLLAAIIDYHENADTREDTWGTSGHSKAVVEFFANYVVATDNTSQVQPSQKATDANMDDSGGNSEVKAEEKPAETMDDVLAAIEHFAKTITYSNNRSVELTVYLKKKKNFMFSMDDPDDIIEQRKLENNSDPKVTDEDWAWQEQKKLLKDFYKAVGKSNPIQEIHTHNKTTGQKETIPGTDKTMAAKIRRFADEKITPIDLASLKRELEEHIKTNLFDDQKIKNPLNGPPNESAVYEAPLNYINSLVQPHPTLTPNDFFKHNLDKTSVYVVGGESGCGKTWFCAKGIIPHLKVQDEPYLLYLKIHDRHNAENERLSDPKGFEENAVDIWRKGVSEILDNYQSIHSTKNLHVLYAISNILHYRRNKWAQMLFEQMIEEQAPQLFHTWLHGQSVTPIGKLIVVIDEMGKNLDFARALIDCHRWYLPRKFVISSTKTLAERCTLVLSGAGLDLIKGNGTSAGTDPEKYQLVELRPPDVSEFSRQYATHHFLKEKEIEQVLNDGTISSIVKTNTRMLMNGLKKILDIADLHGGSEDKYKRRITDLFSLPSFMSLITEWYMKLNGLSAVKPKDRRKYFRRSWRHMLQMCVLSMKDSKTLLKSRYMKRLRISKENDPNDPEDKEIERILTLGITSTIYKIISRALKFLACDAQGDVAAKGDGNSFEDMVMCHIKRMLQVIYSDNDEDNDEVDDDSSNNQQVTTATNNNEDDIDDDVLIGEHVLENDWPKKQDIKRIQNMNKDKIAELVEDANKLDGYRWKMKENNYRDFSTIAELMKPAEDAKTPKAVLISQRSGNSAQGPDLFSLEHDEEEESHFWLNIFQIKNMEKPAGSSTAELISTVGALKSRHSDIEDSIKELSLDEVVEYAGDKDKFATLLQTIYAATKNTSLSDEDLKLLNELKKKMMNNEQKIQDASNAYEDLSVKQKTQFRSKNGEIWKQISELREMKSLENKQEFKQSKRRENLFLDAMNDTIRVYRVQNALEQIRLTLQEKLRVSLADAKVTVTIGDRSVVSTAEESFGEVGDVNGVCSLTKEFLQPTYDCFFGGKPLR
eukprot:CAMPEP_0119550494 /NCGR_PEP_ID=MMETSP1352-20130426/3998_1 /TAXON_ID=265584 /ORGANISM="Stauroneis constricta, Strain CCMP1120" /LENGTH=1148 /DNA_ID=CAMNT_0007596367 /DNA_START=35 /DNA_END=3481 /DNA_ORIENTATION=+